MAIFNSYVKLPEGIPVKKSLVTSHTFSISDKVMLPVASSMACERVTSAVQGTVNGQICAKWL
jgi:hypothetical protein